MGLRGRLLILVLLAVVPAVGIILYNTARDRRIHSQEARASMLMLTEITAARLNQHIEGVRQVLVAVATLTEVRGNDGEACSRLLARLLSQYPQYINFGITDTNGIHFASALPFPPGLSAADRLWFKQAMATREFASGEYQTGRITKKLSLNFALPLKNADGHVERVLYAALDLAWLNQQLKTARLPAGAVLTVVDRTGVVLARSDQPEKWVSKAFSDAPLVRHALQQHSGVAEFHGLDGVLRHYAFACADSSAEAFHVMAGIPRTTALAEVNIRLQNDMTLLAFVVVLALAAAWLAGRIFVVSPVRELLAATDKLATGDLTARVSQPNRRTEIGQLGQAFNDMAVALQTQSVEQKRAEELLRESNVLLSSFVKHSPIYAFIKEVTPTASRVLTASENFREMIGLPGSAIAGKTMEELFPPEFAAKITADDRAVVAGGEVLKVDEDLNGRHYTTIKFPITLRNRTLLAGYTIDMTERTKAEEALQQSQTLLNATGRIAKVGGWEFNLKTQSLTWTEEVYRIHEVAEDFQPTVAAAIDFYTPEAKPVITAAVQRAIAQGEPFDLELQIITAKGKRRWVHAVGEAHAQSGQIAAVGGTFQDITERKLEEEFRTLLATAVEQTADIVVITDTDGTILYVNPTFEKVTGYTREEAIGQNPRLLKSGKHDAAFYRQMWTTLTAGKVWSGHLINKKKDGTFYEEEATISPVYDSAGKTVNYVAVKSDVTHEVALEAQLRQVQKMQAVGQLAGGIAHDFNNLLSAIIGFSDLTLSKMNSTHPFYENISQVAKAGTRAAELTRQLLIFSRKQVLEPKILNLNTVIGDLHKMLRRLVREDIDIVLALSSSAGRVKADPGQLEQVITNMVVNARDAMPHGGILTIATGNATLTDADVIAYPDVTPGDYVQLSIRDTGIGMTDEVKSHIFEPFFTTKPVGEGTGLGLATCYGAVKQNGGHITVESALGRGTTFHIYLPRIAHKAGEEEGTGPLHALPRGTETILLVEDDISVRQLAELILTGLGYQVLVAANGQDALRVARVSCKPIHLLLTDVIMPQMNGKELADALHAEYPQTKVLFVSGYTADAISSDGILEPGVTLLPKPFSSFSLSHKVREVLDS